MMVHGQMMILVWIWPAKCLTSFTSIAELAAQTAKPPRGSLRRV
jgi:hypothetical protein